MLGIYFLFILICLVNGLFSYLVKRNCWRKLKKFQWWQHTDEERYVKICKHVNYFFNPSKPGGEGRQVIFVFCPSAQKNFNSSKTVNATNTRLCNFEQISIWKIFEHFHAPAIYHSWDIWNRHLKFQLISRRNLKKLNYSQLLIEKLYPLEFLTTYLSLKEKTIDVSILFDDITIHNALLKPKKKYVFWHIWWAIALQHLIFMKDGGQAS